MKDGCRQGYYAMRLMAVVVVFACSCSGWSNLPKDEVDLAWPPSAVVEREVSDEDLVLLGREYAEKSDSASTQVDALLLTGGGILPYAIYTASGFSAELELASVTVEFALSPAEPGDGTELFVGLANYGAEAWQWLQATPGEWSVNIASPPDYRSATGLAAIAVVLAGPGTATIANVGFSAVSAIPPTPQNLTATAAPNSVSLDWDDVPNVQGYNVYRASDLSSEGVLVNDGPVLTSEYVDDNVGINRIYYYWVTALRDVESVPTDKLDIYVPHADLPAPENVHVSAVFLDSFTVKWDWSLDHPQQFIVYYATQPEFSVSLLSPKDQVLGFMRWATVKNISPDTTYYFRVVAVDDNGWEGRMTDDQPHDSGVWSWGPVEEIATGSAELRCITAAGDLTLAHQEGGAIVVSRRNQGSWTPETVLPGSYEHYLDLAYAADEYLVLGYDQPTGDLWGAIGAPGEGWATERVHGDGLSGMSRTESGVSCCAAASATEFAAMHLDSTNSTWVVQTMDRSGGGWSTAEVRSSTAGNMHCSIAFDEGNVFALGIDTVTDELLFGDRASSWTWQPVLAGGVTEVGMHNDLVRVGEDWLTPAWDNNETEICLLRGETVPWTQHVVIEPVQYQAFYIHMALRDDGPVFVYYHNSPTMWYFSVPIADGEWFTMPVQIGGVAYGPRGDLVVLDDTPYLIFTDSISGKIMAAPGAPPA